jgi:hypothetical protein
MKTPNKPSPDRKSSSQQFARYATAADARSSDRFAGASAIRAIPQGYTDDDERSHAQQLSAWGSDCRNACTAIRAAWTKLDHALKAIRLRFADGLRAASSQKMPSVTSRLSIIANAGSCRTNIIGG